MVLHHFGDSTLSDVKEVEKECVAAGAKTVVVAGDIAKPETAKDVSLPPLQSLPNSPLKPAITLYSASKHAFPDTIMYQLIGLNYR
jgi:hypothetical protein